MKCPAKRHPATRYRVSPSDTSLVKTPRKYLIASHSHRQACRAQAHLRYRNVVRVVIHHELGLVVAPVGGSKGFRRSRLRVGAQHHPVVIPRVDPRFCRRCDVKPVPMPAARAANTVLAVSRFHRLVAQQRPSVDDLTLCS